ncbi:hypothetical protein [Photobacterium minamisatsumaniensis]|uniref:hypothetical protein n=1 Tax=Photobacterium minamisatsumaniensis TaxID=2910233 RepID=UPI003D09BFEB
MRIKFVKVFVPIWFFILVVNQSEYGSCYASYCLAAAFWPVTVKSLIVALAVYYFFFREEDIEVEIKQREVEKERFQQFVHKAENVHRITHCWACSCSEIDSEHDKKCAECGWLICPECGSCSQNCYSNCSDNAAIQPIHEYSPSAVQITASGFSISKDTLDEAREIELYTPDGWTYQQRLKVMQQLRRLIIGDLAKMENFRVSLPEHQQQCELVVNGISNKALQEMEGKLKRRIQAIS